MRDLIDLVTKQLLSEGEVVPFTQGSKSASAPSDTRVYNMADIDLKQKLLDSLDDFTRAYIEAMFWTEHEELYGKDIDDIEPNCLSKIKAECESFERAAGENTIAAYGVRQAGYDFWLTRNGHGAGFWECDHCDKPTGKRLTQLSDKFGNADAYVGDDGLVYC